MSLSLDNEIISWVKLNFWMILNIVLYSVKNILSYSRGICININLILGTFFLTVTLWVWITGFSFRFFLYSLSNIFTILPISLSSSDSNITSSSVSVLPFVSSAKNMERDLLFHCYFIFFWFTQLMYKICPSDILIHLWYITPS